MKLRMKKFYRIFLTCSCRITYFSVVPTTSKHTVLYYSLEIRSETINVAKYPSSVVIEIGRPFSFAEKNCSGGCSGRGHVNIPEEKLQ